MKACTFLEIYKAEKSHGRGSPFDFMDADKAIEMYCGLVSQEFYVEMITRYFHGWVKDIPSEVDYIFTEAPWKYSVIDFSQTENKSFIYKSENPMRSWKEQFPKPKTLNDFIADCERANIKLIWNYEVFKNW